MAVVVFHCSMEDTNTDAMGVLNFSRQRGSGMSEGKLAKSISKVLTRKSNQTGLNVFSEQEISHALRVCSAENATVVFLGSFSYVCLCRRIFLIILGNEFGG